VWQINLATVVVSFWVHVKYIISYCIIRLAIGDREPGLKDVAFLGVS